MITGPVSSFIPVSARANSYLMLCFVTNALRADGSPFTAATHIKENYAYS